MAPYAIDATAWQESWDRQQEGYLPGREYRFTTMLDVVESIVDRRPPAILDLAGGTGSISLRALRRFPHATATLLDLDPVVMAIAQASLDSTRSTIAAADLNTPHWSEVLPRQDYDAVLTATALHWIGTERLTALYAEIREVLRPGGVFINADHMPEEGLPELGERVKTWHKARREARQAAGAVLSWEAWWDRAAADPVLGPLVRQREKVSSGAAATAHPPVSWHLKALRLAGFTEVGLVWRDGQDAAFAAVR